MKKSCKNVTLHKKQCLLIVLIIIMVSSVCLTAFAEDKDPTSGFYSVHTSFEGMPMGFVYHDNMLSGSANDFSADLAKASAVLAAKAYGSLTGINSLMQNSLGFENRWQNNYNRTATYKNNDFVAYSIHSKEVSYNGDNYIIYCIPVRGTPVSGEWYSDFHMEEGEAWHTGFSTAASEVQTQLLRFIAGDSYPDSKTKIWITGHSRGAAVANLVAGHLSNGEQTSVPRGNIFCYTFACPNVGRSGLCPGFQNIRNFNNNGDFITMLPLESWGYGRYGQTIRTSISQQSNIVNQFSRRAGKGFHGIASTTYYEDKLSEIITSQEEAFSTNAQIIFTLMAWWLSGHDINELDSICHDKGWAIAKTLWDIVSRAMNLSSPSDALEQMQSEVGAYIDERKNFHDDGIRVLSEYDPEKDGDFETYLYEKTGYTFSEYVEKCFSYSILDIFPIETYEQLYDLLNQINTDDPMTKAVKLVLDLFAFNHVNAIGDGHDWRSYLCWMDSSYYGYQGHYGATGENISVSGVSTIGYQCFSESSISNVNLGEGLQYIDRNAFFNSSLSNISFPETLTEISDSCFFGCSNLRELTIPNSVTKLGLACFTNCSGLKNITMPIELYGKDRSTSDNPGGAGYDAFCYPYYVDAHGIYVYGSYHDSLTTSVESLHFTSADNGEMLNLNNIFGQCPYSLTLAYHCRGNLHSVVFDEGITNIGDYAFADCLALTDVTLPSTIQSIGNYSFSSCSQLTHINMPENVLTIGDYAFYKCSLLEEPIVLPEGLSTIGNSCFANCGALLGISFPSTLEEIPDSAFFYCSALTDLIIPNTITKLGIGCFTNCSGLKNVTMPIELYGKDRSSSDNAGGVGYDAFTYPYHTPSPYNDDVYSTSLTTHVETLHFTTANSGEMLPLDNTYDICPYTKTLAYYCRDSLVSILLDDGITNISDYAFTASSILTDVTLPSTIETIGICAFSECAQLPNINVPDNLVTIGSSAFSGCSLLTGPIDLPEGLTTIGNSCFANCSALLGISFPSTLEEIPDSAFFYCSALTDLIIPTTITKLGVGCFTNCNGLKNVTMPIELYGKDRSTSGSPGGVGYDAFTYPYHTPSPYNYNVYSTSLTTQVETLHFTTANSGEMLPLDNTYDICPYTKTLAYSCRGSLVSVLFDDGITNISDYAFTGSSVLTNVILPSTIETIGISAFSGCVQLPDINMPENLVVIGSGAFSGCSLLSGPIVFAEGLTTIGSSCFANCSALSGISFPSTLVDIQSSAFYNCAALTELIIPNSVTKLGVGTFTNCSGLKSLTIPIELYGKDRSPEGSRFGSGYDAFTYPYSNPSPYNSNAYASSLTTHVETLHFTAAENGIMLDMSNSSNSNWYSSTLAYYCRSSLKTVIFDEGAIHIGNYALYGCSTVTDVTLPISLESVGTNAFSGCSKLITASYPGSQYDWNHNVSVASGNQLLLNSLNCAVLSSPCGQNAWYLYKDTILIIYGSGSIEDECFAGLTNFTSVVIDEGIIRIGELAFADCTSLQQITIPQSITSIGTNAFFGCTNLAEAIYSGAMVYWNRDVTVEDGNECLINVLMFGIKSGYCGAETWYIYDHSALEIYGAGEINAESFEGLTDFTTVFVDNGISRIGEKAFADCTALSALSIPDSLADIGDYAFRGCSNCAVIIFCGNAPYIGINAFDSVVSDVYYYPSLDGWTEDRLQNYGGTLTWYALDSQPEHIHLWGSPVYSWAGDNSCVTATIVSPDDGSIFKETISATRSILQSPTTEMKGTLLYTSDYFSHEAFTVQTKTASIPSLSTMHVMNLPSGLQIIETDAFASAVFEAVIVPDTCMYIGSGAFRDCKNLIYIRFPAGTEIETDAFEGCNDPILDSIVIP